MSETGKPSREKKRRHPRYDYRARSHESAHAAAENEPRPEIPIDPLIPRNAAELLATQDQLEGLIGELRQAGSFAYDSEFIGELSYFPKLCLIQVATGQKVTLVDALGDVDLHPFWELLADASVEKIVHAGEQDLEPVWRHLGRPAANVFDTQVAAGFTALAYPAGLSKLVKSLVGVQLGKGFTFTHWDQRPLSAVQMRYAADDVRYLPALRRAIGQRLEARGHAAWAKEECESLADPSKRDLDPSDQVRRMRGGKSLSPRNASVLMELLAWREAAARRHDSPPRSYLRDEILLDMAREPVTTVEGLVRVKGLPRPVEAAEGESIVEAVQRGLAEATDDTPPPETHDESPAERFAADSLWAVAQAWCASHGVDPNLVGSRQEVLSLARRIAAGQDPAAHRLTQGWRGELLGSAMRDLLEGHKPLTIAWNGGDSGPGGIEKKAGTAE